MIKALIFDYMGVVIDSPLQAIINKLKKSDPEKVVRIEGLLTASNSGSISVEVARASIAGELGLTVGSYMDQMQQSGVTNRQLLDRIQNLKATHKTALLSNSDRTDIETHGLAGYFDAIIITGETGYSKSSSDIYRLAASKLRVEPKDCVMIDDREVYCRAAQAAEMKTIVYQSFEQFMQQLALLQKS